MSDPSDPEDEREYTLDTLVQGFIEDLRHLPPDRVQKFFDRLIIELVTDPDESFAEMATWFPPLLAWALRQQCERKMRRKGGEADAV